MKFKVGDKIGNREWDKKKDPYHGFIKRISESSMTLDLYSLTTKIWFKGFTYLRKNDNWYIIESKQSTHLPDYL